MPPRIATTPRRTLLRWQRLSERAGLAAAIDRRGGYRDAASPGSDCPLIEDWLAGHPDGAVAVTMPTPIWEGDIRVGGHVAIYDRDAPGEVGIRAILAVQDDLFGGGRTLLLGASLPRKAWPTDLRRTIRGKCTARTAGPKRTKSARTRIPPAPPLRKELPCS